MKAARVDSLVVAKDFAGAMDVWKTASKCNVESLYRNGEKILTDKLSTRLSDAEKADYSAMLLKLYADYDRNFPGNNNSNAVKKALYLYRSDKNNPEIYELLDRAFTKDRDNFSDANALQIYFSQYYNMKMAEQDKSMAAFAVIRKRDEISQRLAKLYADTGNKDYKIISEAIHRQAMPVATCENLDKYYAKEIEFKANQDAAWMQTTAEALADDCPRSEYYYKAAAKWHELAPGSKSAFHMAQALMQQRGKKADAIKYYTQAAASETDPLQQAEIYLTLAVHHITDQQKAIGYLQSALKAKPDFGKAYLLLAEVYSSTECGNNAFEKKARYTLAAQTAMKAYKVEPGLKQTAEAQAANYNKKGPTSAEIKDAKMSGKTVTFACGINESVTLP